MRTRLRMRLRARRGFSLVELLIAMVVGVVLGTALVRLALTQSLFVGVQRMSSESRLVASAGLGLVQSEMRMIEVRRNLSTAILTANDSVFDFRMPMAFGVLCSSTTALVQPSDSVRMTMSGRTPRMMDGYATRLTSTGQYAYTPVAGTSWLTTGGESDCDASPRINRLPGLRALSFTGAPVAGYTASVRGAPIMFWVRVRYRFGNSTTFPGRRALYRVFGSGTPVDSMEFIAPLDTGARFRYYDSTAVNAPLNAAPPLNTISGVQLSLPGMSQTTIPNRQQAEVTRLVTSVFFRNYFP